MERPCSKNRGTMKSSFLAVFFLGAAVAACSGTGTPSGQGGEGGEDPTTSGNSTSSSSSGMGGAGGSGMGGMGGMGGGAPALSADKLGQVCDPMTAMTCPMGYSCILVGMGATSGFCTLPCTGLTDMKTCSQPNGFPGPGLGVCNVQIQNQPGNYCGVVCGAQYNLPDMCPTGLTCKDTLDAATKMPGMDGKTDFCVP